MITLPDFLKKLGSQITGFFRKMTKGQRTRLIVFVMLLVAILIAVSVITNQKNYTVLYSGMDPKDAGDVMTKLTALKVEAKTQGTDTILVPSDQADSLRMTLASEGYPQTGFNYDIYKNASGLGTTDSQEEFYRTMQIQANIVSTLKQMEKVDDAAVHLNLGETSSFVLSDNNKPATASVTLKLKNGVTLNNNEVSAIGELVSKSVKDLSIENVRIVDTKMHLYTIKDSDSSSSADMGSQMELQNSVQDKLQEQVKNLLEPVFGIDKVLAQVHVILDFDKQTTSSTVFTPPVEGSDKGIAISMKELAETVKNNGSGTASGISGNGGAITYPTVTGQDTIYNQVSNETNMEVNQLKTDIEKAPGTIKDLSVAVILDGDGSATDYREQVKNLVASAIGVPQDKVTAEYMPFNVPDNTSAQAAIDNQVKLVNAKQSGELTNTIIISIAAVVCALILFGIIRTFRRPKSREEQYAVATGQGQIDYIAGEEVMPESVYDDIDLSKKNNEVQQVEKFIDKDPEAVAQLLRNWLAE
jgi:flagellar M-ring protein FliF